jgi:hypothetical protein
MKALQRDTRGRKRVNNRQGMEMLLFLVASAISIYALGKGLTGLFEPGKGVDLLWLAVAVAAMKILFAQMGRVHDTWPRRHDSYEQRIQQAVQPSAVPAEEREG